MYNGLCNADEAEIIQLLFLTPDEKGAIYSSEIQHSENQLHRQTNLHTPFLKVIQFLAESSHSRHLNKPNIFRSKFTDK